VSVAALFESALRRYAQGTFASEEQKTSANLKLSNANANSTISSTQGLCVAYSGGLDSTVLLHVAKTFCKNNNIALSAAHVNHGISKHAETWQKHCEEQCAELNIPFATQSLSLKKRPQHSLEADARDARYSILDSLAQPNSIVVLAQHQDDQAETFLLQLKRGAGVKGLAAMPVIMARKSGVQYLRPLLEATRADILLYARRHKLTWIDDESNQDIAYDRNFLRNQVLPLLTQRWPSFSKAVARSTRHCAQENAVNTEYMDLLWDRLVEAGSIDLSQLSTQSPATQSSFIRHWLATEHDLSPASAQLSDILRMAQVVNNLGRKNTSPHIVLGSKAIERYKDKLTVIPLAKQTPLKSDVVTRAGFTKLEWGSEKILTLNESYSLKRAATTSTSNSNVFLLPEKDVEYVFGGSNINFKYQKNRPSKKMKAWYQEWGVSPIQRQQTPVFVSDNRAIAIGLEPIKKSCVDLKHAIYVELCKSPLI